MSLTPHLLPTAAGCESSASHAFLSILDRWTNVGIYVISHTFTMAELLAMSGFYLTSSSIKASISAADESVRLLDGIFGSNETSRALSSFITLVRREFSDDPRFAGRGVWSLAALTKALTAFAVLQNATHRRSVKAQKMRVLYDCTVLGEVESKSWRARMVGSGNFNFKNASRQPIVSIPARSSSQPVEEAAAAAAGRQKKLPKAPEPKHLPQKTSRHRSLPAGALLFTDSRSQENGIEDRPAGSGSKAPLDDDASILADLDYLVGAGEEGDAEEGPDNGSLVVSTSVHGDELPDDMRELISRTGDEDLEHGVVIDQKHQPGPREIKRIVKKRPGRGIHETVFEITTETIETVETTTTVQRRAPAGGRQSQDQARRLLKPPFGAFDESRTRRDVTTSHKGHETESVHGDRHKLMTTEEDEWCEIAQTVNRRSREGSDDEVEDQLRTGYIPEVPNGGPAHSIGALTRQDTIDHPEESRQRIQLVLKSMTRKLVQKKRIVRQTELVDTDLSLESDAELNSPDVTPPFSAGVLGWGGKDKGVETYRSARTAPSSPRSGSRWRAPSLGDREPRQTTRMATVGEGIGLGLQRALNKAKGTLKGGKEKVPIRPPLETRSTDTTMRTASSSEPATPPPTPPPEVVVEAPQTPSKSRRERSPTRPAPSEMSAASASGSVPPRIAPVPAARRSHDLNKKLPAPPHGHSHGHGHGTGEGRGTKRRARAQSITSMRSFASRTHMQSTSTAPCNATETVHEQSQFPKAHLVHNLYRFMKHSSAAYGQNFMRILGIGQADYFFPDTSKHHANVWAFAHHVGIPVDNILLSSFTDPPSRFHSEKMSPLVNYVAVDEESKAVVLTCRVSILIRMRRICFCTKLTGLCYYSH